MNKGLRNMVYYKTQGAIALLGYLFYVLIIGYIFNLFSLNISFLLLNLLCLSIPYFFIMALSGRSTVTLLIASVFAFLIGYADTCVFAARLTHIRVTDFSAIGQAMRVVSNYSLIWSGTQWRNIILLLALVVFLFLITTLSHFKISPFQTRITAAAILLLLCIATVEGTIFNALPISQGFSGFDSNENVKEAGLIGYWYSQIVRSKSKKPKGYSLDKATHSIGEYTDDQLVDDFEPVNIIVIMNESLTDYSLLGKIQFDDPLPYIHSMVESGELFEGKLASSVLGGGTCNTEYEFLTGNSMAFLPDGVYAFMAYVTHESDSIARELEQCGYHTSFFHPYYSQEWNRETVYSFFGFDSFTAGDTLDGGLKNKDSVKNITYIDKDDALVFGNDLEYVRHLISDLQTYKLLMDMLPLDNAVADDFIYCVTIQNHGGYTYEGDGFESMEYVTGDDTYKYVMEAYNGKYSSRPSVINQYLTLSNLSDSAFQELINELSQSNEKTLLVMFGDHQPGISISDYIEYDKNVHLSVEEETHVVPYLVWSNFDLDYEFPAYISANYLSSVIKQSVGMPFNAWDKFRMDVMKQYPVLTTGFVLDSEYNVVENKDTELLKDYSYIQYMRMFER